MRESEFYRSFAKFSSLEKYGLYGIYHGALRKLDQLQTVGVRVASDMLQLAIDTLKLLDVRTMALTWI